jgi:hypothetical protein
MLFVRNSYRKELALIRWFPGDKRKRYYDETACTLAWVASGWRRLVYIGLFHRINLPFSELEMLEHACKIKHVIRQHQSHCDQVGSQHAQ